jgi:Fe2+ or Zn2+ uptake regulation protein
MPSCKCSQHRPATSLAKLEQKLRGRASKITGQRVAILEVMRLHQHPLTIKEIAAELPGRRCDLATIYRSMHLLVRMRMVARFDFGDGTARFELIGDDAHAHHHHLVCTGCGAVVEIGECFPEELQQSIARRHGYKSVTHKLEFFGLCPRCQRNAGSPAK